MNMPRPGMGIPAPAIPTYDPKGYAPKPLLSKLFTPKGELMACQWVRGPEPINEGKQNLYLPDNLKMESSGLQFLTPILRVVAVGPDVKGVAEDDLILLASGCTFFLVNYGGHEYIMVHQQGVFGTIDREHEFGLRDLIPPPTEGVKV